MENRISGTLSPEEVTAIKNEITALRARMVFLKEFKPEEIARMPKLGEKSLEFVRAAVEGVQACGDHMSRSFDIQEYLNDYALYQALLSIELALDVLARLVSNTRVALGGDLMEGSLEVYHALQRAPKGSGAETYVDGMKRYWKSRYSAPEAEEDDAEAASSVSPAEESP